MSKRDARKPGDKLISYWQIRQIENLLRRIGIPASVDGMRALQGKVGASQAPYAYRLMSRAQGANFIATLWEYVKEAEDVGTVAGASGAGEGICRDRGSAAQGQAPDGL